MRGIPIARNYNCEGCGISRKGDTDGSIWEEYEDDYETLVRTFWYCDKDDIKARENL